MSFAFSTGPLENATPAGPSSATVWTKVLNNHHHTRIRATVKVFRLNGYKTLLSQTSFKVDPMASRFTFMDVSAAPQFEVQISICPGRDPDDVLVSVFGKDMAGNLNPSHRLVQQELTPIGDLTFTDDDPDVTDPSGRPAPSGDDADA
jgi:hypothetical protein